MQKKRDSPDNNERRIRQKLISEYATQINCKNSFQALSKTPNTDTDERQEKLIVHKPPPIFLSQIIQIQPLLETLNSVASNEYTIKVSGRNQVKVMPSTAVN